MVPELMVELLLKEMAVLAHWLVAEKLALGLGWMVTCLVALALQPLLDVEIYYLFVL